MSAGTVISGGFPGRVAQEVQPNPKCRGCLHYVDSAGRTGACSIGLRPWLCGDTGDAADIGYAPIDGGAGAYLPGMSNHGAHAHEVETQFVSDLYGAGSTRPVSVQQVSLGEEHVHFVKSFVDRYMEMERKCCRFHQGVMSHGVAPANTEPQVCTCEPIAAHDVAKALVPRLSNRARSVMSFDDVIAFVYDVAKAGYKMPVEKGATRSTSDSGRTSATTQAPTRQIKTAKTPPGMPSMKDAVSVAKKALHWTEHPTGQKQATTTHGAYRHSDSDVHYMPWASPGRLGNATKLGEGSSKRKLRALAEEHHAKMTGG